MVPFSCKIVRCVSASVLFLIVLILALSDARAQTANPQETLKQYCAELKKNPNNYALREKIIKLVRTMKPAPAIPADAKNYAKRAESAFNKAKTEADFTQAAKEYDKALLIAPWVSNYYYNCAVTYEKAAKPEEAMHCYELYLAAVPRAGDAGTIRRHIADLDKQVQIANSQDAFKQYCADLKKNPNDYALRDKIIRLVRTMKPAPAVPADAEKYASSAESAFSKAKSGADIAKAAKEYEKALLIAPWVPDYYYNCAVIYERVLKPEKAIHYYDLYLVAAPKASDAYAIHKHIADLEDKVYRVEKIEGATIEMMEKEAPIAGAGPYASVSVIPFEASYALLKDYKDPIIQFRVALISDLRSRGKFSKIIDGSTDRSPATLKVTGKVLNMRITGTAARIWGGAMAGSSWMQIYVKATDTRTGKVVAEKIIATNNNAWGAAWSNSDMSMPVDMAQIISAYLCTVIPAK